MRVLPANLATAMQQAHLAPLYVLEIMWADGAHGIEGVNDIYFASSDISDIINFPYPDRYYPILDATSISGLSQTVDPLNGVSSIGSMSFRLVDRNNYFSDIVRAADVAGHGLRRQMCQLYRLERGMDWADRIKVRTMQIDDLNLAHAGTEYKLRAVDVQRQLKRDICNPGNTMLNVPITTTGAISATVGDATILPLVPNHYYGASGHIKINDEVMRFTAVTGSVLTIPLAGRGLFGTLAATHAQGDPVQEIIVLRGNPIALALQLMSSTGTGTNGLWDVYPKHWGCDMDAVEDINTPEWQAVGQFLTGFDTPSAADGLQFEFVLDDSIEAKSFIESEILRFVGAFGFVHGDGRYGVRAYSDLSNADKLAADRTLTDDDVVSWSDLRYDYTQIVNEIKLTYDRWPKYGGKFIRHTYFVDAVSKTKWGDAKALKFKVEGLVPATQFVNTIYQRNHLWMSRFSRPPMRIDVTLLPKHFDLEIGDVVRLTLPIPDLITGATLDRAFEVLSTNQDTKAGRPKLSLMAQPEKVTLWQGANLTPNIADSAYPHGTQVTWVGAGAQVVDQPRTLNSGDHWVNGDFTVNAGQTLTLNGSVRLFVRGTFTNHGHIDGAGRGPSGAARGVWSGPSFTAFDFDLFNQGLGPYHSVSGSRGQPLGFSGKGGDGGSRWYRYGSVHFHFTLDIQAWTWPLRFSSLAPGGRGLPGAVQFNVAPAQVNAQAGGVDAANAWTSVVGLPHDLAGSGGGGGSFVKYNKANAAASDYMLGGGSTSNSAYGGAGGAGGAGFLVMAQQVYNTLGTIDLTGAAAENGDGYMYREGSNLGGGYAAIQYWINGGGGGGGGGSCILLAGRDAFGLPSMTVDDTRINTAGGLGKGGNPAHIGYDDNLAAYAGRQGSAGKIITQVIG